MESIFLLPFAARRLEGKVALITGGASGIGECTAKLFSRHGAKVVIADIQDDRGTAFCNSLCAAVGPGTATYVHCDVTDESHVRTAVDTAVEVHGKLDIMFNNAGILGAVKNRILDTEKWEFEHVMATNLTGSFLGTKHAARVMIPAGKGSIIMTASVASVMGGLATYAYTCSKHALVGLARDAAVELGAHGVRVNCVSPFVVATPLATSALREATEAVEELFRRNSVLKGATLKAEDVAEAVLYLASEESKFVSGHNLVVDGAFTTTHKIQYS